MYSAFVESKEGSSGPNSGPWTCPSCTYELTPASKRRCGVCDLPRPGFDGESSSEEEEELETAKKATPTKTPSANKPIVASNISASKQQSYARLLLIQGAIFEPQLAKIVSAVNEFSNAEKFVLEGTVDNLRKTRDIIILRLRAGKSCIVYDAAVTIERQKAWLTICGRCHVSCDLLVLDKNHALTEGFAFVHYSPVNMAALTQPFRISAKPIVDLSKAAQAGVPSVAVTGSSSEGSIPKQIVLDLTQDDD